MTAFPRPPFSAVGRQHLKNGAAFVNGAYSAGNAWSVKIDRQSVHVTAGFRYYGTVSTLLTPGTPTARVRNGPQALGTLMRVNVNGKDEVNAHPDLLLARAQWSRGKLATLGVDKLTTAELAVASTFPTFSGQLPFDFCPPQQDPEHTGLLFGSKCGDVEVSGTWGTISDLCITPGTCILNAAQIVLTKDFTDWKPGQLTEIQKKQGWGHYVLRQVGDLSTASNSFVATIPGGRAYTRFFVRAVAGSTPDAADTPLAGNTTEFRLKRGSDNIIQKLLADLFDDRAAGFPSNYDPTGQLVVDCMKGFSPNERAVITRSVLSSGLQPLTIEIDNTGVTGGRIDILTEEYRDPVTSMGERYGLAA